MQQTVFELQNLVLGVMGAQKEPEVQFREKGQYRKTRLAVSSFGKHIIIDRRERLCHTVKWGKGEV